MESAREGTASRPVPPRTDRAPQRRSVRALRDGGAHSVRSALARLPPRGATAVLDAPRLAARGQRAHRAALAAVDLDGHGHPRVPAGRRDEPDPLAVVGAPPPPPCEGIRARPDRRSLDLPRPRWPLASRRW